MRKWPISRWNQGLISLVVAAVSAYIVFVRTESALFERYAKEAPYDGQDGLSAFMGALQASLLTLVGVLLALYVVQRLVTATRSAGSN
jgi:hypothetical protein